jgi:hypothetical protein
MLEFLDLIVLSCDLRLQRVYLLPVGSDHAAQGELVFIELLHAALIGASGQRECREDGDDADRPVRFSHSSNPYWLAILVTEK